MSEQQQVELGAQKQELTQEQKLAIAFQNALGLIQREVNLLYVEVNNIIKGN